MHKSCRISLKVIHIFHIVGATNIDDLNQHEILFKSPVGRDCACIQSKHDTSAGRRPGIPERFL